MKDEMMVFVRIGLYAASGYLVRGGWLPDDIAEMVKSPAAVEAVTGALLGLGTLVWYWFSKARAALVKK